MLNFFRKYSPIPDYVISYHDLFKDQKKIFSQDIEETNFTVFDIESTGLKVKKDVVLSIGAVNITNNKILIDNNLELYINQSVAINESASIHGILIDGINYKISEEESLIKFLDYIKNSILVGHNVGYDVQMINQLLTKYAGSKLKNYVLDTRLLYGRIRKGDQIKVNEDSLDSLCREFNIPQSDRHTAAGDAFITAILFMKLINRLKKRGVVKVGDLLKNGNRII